MLDLASEATCGNPANLPANNGGITTWYNSDNIHYTATCGALLGPVAVTSIKTVYPGLLN